ncbi:MAG: helix-turn-helix domain-containing protein [Acidobacteria bacterium]|nr:MAG: helix-turn-helix domain-containing protein [Acidobacteriota bacterium]REK08525.1 MAG: helix-turn-helix domain-containing protein [Acidobacteriota bacterium]
MPSPLQRLLPLLVQLADGEERTSLAELSRLDGRSATHLQRVFQATIGESPLQFERRVRLQRAALSLALTGSSILEIALDAGFDSHEGFTRAFRRHFGCSPGELRRRVSQHRGRHAPFSESAPPTTTTPGPPADRRLAHRIAPCVGLYRAPLYSEPNTKRSHSRRGDVTMDYEIEKKSIEKTGFLYQRRDVAPDQLAQAFGEIFGAVFQHAISNGLELAGRPTARYPKFGPGLITVEAGMPIAGEIAPAQGFEVGHLGGCTVAATHHLGPYDALGEAHQAVERWIAEEGEEVAGYPCEIYVTDPGEEPDPGKWLTEVHWPLVE